MADVGVEQELLRRSLNPSPGEAEMSKWRQDPLAEWLMSNSLPLRAGIEYGGLGHMLPTAPSLEEMERGLAGGNAPLGQASVRQFAKGIDPSIDVIQMIKSPKERLRDWVSRWMDKNDLIAPGTPPDLKNKLLDAMSEMGASGIRGLKGLMNALEKKKIVNVPATEAPHLRFSVDPNYTTSAAAHVQSYNMKGSGYGSIGPARYLAGIEYKPPTVAETSMNPNFFFEALPEELAHQATGVEAKSRLGEQSTPYGGNIAVSAVLGTLPKSLVPLTPVDEAVLQRYLINTRNLPWKQEYKGVNNPETNPREFLEAFIRPIFEPRRFRSEFGLGRMAEEDKYAALTGGKSNYWSMWEKEPEIFKKVHELLEVPIPRSARLKNPSLFMDPQKQLALDMFQAEIEKAGALYRKQVMPGTPPVKKPTSP